MEKLLGHYIYSLCQVLLDKTTYIYKIERWIYRAMYFYTIYILYIYPFHKGPMVGLEQYWGLNKLPSEFILAKKPKERKVTD